MKSKENYLKRLETFQNYFKHYPKSKLKDLCEHFNQLPYGTISATLSFMYQSGHLTKNDQNEYSLPAVVSTAKQIAGDIAKMQKAKRILNVTKSQDKQLGFFVNGTWHDGEHTLTIQKRIEQAIELLKSNGYKILAKKTEYAEI